MKMNRNKSDKNKSDQNMTDQNRWDLNKSKKGESKEGNAEQRKSEQGKLKPGKISRKNFAKAFSDMSLGKKVFIYSIGIALVFSVAFLLYTVVMLPGLYEENINKIEIDEALDFHKEVVEKGIDSKNIKLPSSNVTGVVFSKNEPTIKILDSFGKFKVDIQDDDMRSIYMQIIKKADSFKENELEGLEKDKNGKSEINILRIFEIPEEKLNKVTSKFNQMLRIEFQGKNIFKFDKDEQNESIDYKTPEKNLYIITATYKERGMSYINRFIVTDKADSFVVTMSPMLSRGFNHIAEVVAKSIPMVLVLIGLISYIATRIFSKMIVYPMISLQRKTRLVSETKTPETIAMDREDEIGVLSRDIENFYHRLKKQYDLLLEENEKREIVLRSFSHKLKTPVAASIMIIDAMVDNIGDFRENPAYLKDLRSRIIETQKSIERLLRLEYKTQLTVNPISPADVLLNLLKKYSSVENSRKVSWEVTGDAIWQTDGVVLEEILENLVANCFKHSKGDFHVDVKVWKSKITLINRPAHVPEDVLRNAFEPFVSRVSEKGSGLGLYIAKYNAKRLGLALKIENVEDGVQVTLEA